MPSGGGSSGGSSSFQVLGPFRVNFDDPGITTGVVLATLPVGCVVLRTFAMVQTGWTPSAGGRFLVFAVGDYDGFHVLAGASWCDEDNAGSWSGLPAVLEFEEATGQPVLTQEAQPLSVKQRDSVDGADPPLTGVADLYAVIATLST